MASGSERRVARMINDEMRSSLHLDSENMNALRLLQGLCQGNCLRRKLLETCNLHATAPETVRQEISDCGNLAFRLWDSAEEDDLAFAVVAAAVAGGRKIGSRRCVLWLPLSQRQKFGDCRRRRRQLQQRSYNSIVSPIFGNNNSLPAAFAAFNARA